MYNPTCHRLALLLAALTLPPLPPAAAAPSKTPPTVEELRAQLLKPETALRLAAIKQVHKQRLREALPELRQVLSDENPKVRTAAAQALALLGDQQARPLLAAQLSSGGSRGQEALQALKALDRAKGKPRYLMVVSIPSVEKGVDSTEAPSLRSMVADTLDRSTVLVVSGGEESALTPGPLAAHLKSRGLMGLMAQPSLTQLEISREGKTTTIRCKVGLLLATLDQQRMDFSSYGEAKIGSTGNAMTPAFSRELVLRVLRTATEAAADDLIAYLEQGQLKLDKRNQTRSHRPAKNKRSKKKR